MNPLAVRAHAAREMVRLLRRRPGSFVLAVLLAAAAFTIPLTGASIARSAAPLAAQLPLGPEINVFLAPAVPAAEIRQLQSRLAGHPGVIQVEWITRDSALKTLAQRTGNSALGELKDNPLPDVLVVTLSAQTAPDQVEQAVSDMRGLPRVETVVADTGWHRKVKTMLSAVGAAGAVVGALAAVLLVLIVLASVQLQLASSAEEMWVLRLVGADTRFIVRPFAYAGALTLGCGIALAAGLSWAGLEAAAPQVADLAKLYGVELALEPLPLRWLAAATVGAAVLGGVAAALGTRWALRSVR